MGRLRLGWVLVFYDLQPVCVIVPVDVEMDHQGIPGQDVPLELREVWLWVLLYLWVGVFIVDLIAHGDELLPTVGVGDEAQGHTEGIAFMDKGSAGDISLKDEHVSPCIPTSTESRVG